MNNKKIMEILTSQPVEKWEVINFGSFFQLRNEVSTDVFVSLYLTFPDPENNFYEFEFRNKNEDIIYLKQVFNSKDIDDISDIFEFFMEKTQEFINNIPEGTLTEEEDMQRYLTEFKLFLM